MAINYTNGTPTTKIYLMANINNDQYMYGWNANGTLSSDITPDSNLFNTHTQYLTNPPRTIPPWQIHEKDYIDIGIVTDEREELALGGISWSSPGSSASQRLYWAISGKVLRLTISGIIPDGDYVSVDGGDMYNGRSNTSVFRTKMNKLYGYVAVIGKDAYKMLSPATLHYRRKGIYEYYRNGDDIPSWVLTNYSISYITGSRNMQYTLSLDFSNNDFLITKASDDNVGIHPRTFGDIQ